MSQPAVFLDRDGTLIEEAGYLDRLERLVFFPYSIDAVRLLNRANLTVVIVTNQAGTSTYTAIRMGYAFNGRAMTHVHDETWTWDGQQTSCPTGYSISWGREFRYDGPRQVTPFARSIRRGCMKPSSNTLMKVLSGPTTTGTRFMETFAS